MRISDWSSDVCSSDLEHDDRRGGFVGEEKLQHIDEVGAVRRIAADADGSGLSKARSGGLVDRLIGERARTADDADRALGEDVARHDTVIAFVGSKTAWEVRHDQPPIGPGPIREGPLRGNEGTSKRN